MTFPAKSATTRLVDSLRYSIRLRNLAARVKLIVPDSGNELQRAIRAYELASDPVILTSAQKRIERAISHLTREEWLSLRPGWENYQAILAKDPQVSRTLLLKPPGSNGEKGVIFCYFEYNWLRLLTGIEDFQRFTENYTVIYAASWSPTSYGVLGFATASTDQPIYVQPANTADVEKLRTFHPTVRPLDTLACDWINPAFYQPLPWNERDIDILVVANWAPFKRHWELFETLLQLPEDLKVVCVGQRQSGVTLDDIRSLQNSYGVKQKIEYLESIPIDEVTRLQCRAKISALFSRWEGGCVAVTEAFAAGSIVAMREDAHIGSRAHINEASGISFRRSNAAQRISEVLSNGAERTPREWSSQNISCSQTSAKLNQRLKRDSLDEGRPWTQDIATLCYRPYPVFVSDADRVRLKPDFAELSRKWPDVFPDNLVDISSR